MATFGEHPRLAHMLLASEALGCLQLGCLLAALVSNGDIMRSGSASADITLRLRALISDISGQGGVPPHDALHDVSGKPLPAPTFLTDSCCSL
jgi:ATP-dependent helicase HrpB